MWATYLFPGKRHQTNHCLIWRSTCIPVMTPTRMKAGFLSLSLSLRAGVTEMNVHLLPWTTKWVMTKTQTHHAKHLQHHLLTTYRHPRHHQHHHRRHHHHQHHHHRRRRQHHQHHHRRRRHCSEEASEANREQAPCKTSLWRTRTGRRCPRAQGREEISNANPNPNPNSPTP